MSDHNELITKFTDVTGVTEDRAKFYLESSNYGLQVIYNLTLQIKKIYF